MTHTDYNVLRDTNAKPWFAGFCRFGEQSCVTKRFETFDEAKRYIIECIKHDEGQANNEELAETLCAFAEGVNLENGPFEDTRAGVAYCVVREDDDEPSET